LTAPGGVHTKGSHANILTELSTDSGTLLWPHTVLISKIMNGTKIIVKEGAQDAELVKAPHSPNSANSKSTTACSDLKEDNADTPVLHIAWSKKLYCVSSKRQRKLIRTLLLSSYGSSYCWSSIPPHLQIHVFSYLPLCIKKRLDGWYTSVSVERKHDKNNYLTVTEKEISVLLYPQGHVSAQMSTSSKWYESSEPTETEYGMKCDTFTIQPMESLNRIQVTDKMRRLKRPNPPSNQSRWWIEVNEERVVIKVRGWGGASSFAMEDNDLLCHGNWNNKLTDISVDWNDLSSGIFKFAVIEKKTDSVDAEEVKEEKDNSTETSREWLMWRNTSKKKKSDKDAVDREFFYQSPDNVVMWDLPQDIMTPDEVNNLRLDMLKRESESTKRKKMLIR
jgi:hypothetical protein